MKTQWIVIANTVSARIFRRNGVTAPLVPVTVLTHDRSRLHAIAMEPDSDGNQGSDNYYEPNHFEPRTEARRNEHHRFARDIAERLDAGLNAGEFDELTLFASNPFMGELKAQLSEAVAQRVKATLNNDLTHVGLAELDRRMSGSWSAVL